MRPEFNQPFKLAVDIAIAFLITVAILTVLK